VALRIKVKERIKVKKNNGNNVRAFVIPEGADLRVSDQRTTTEFYATTGRVTLPGGGRKVIRPATI
jgi:hypothetical protein